MYYNVKGDILMACNNKKCDSPAVCCTTKNVCERTCIEVDKVFDVCMQQRSIPVTLLVTFTSSPTGYTINSLTNPTQGVISNLIVSPIDKSLCSRVRYTLVVPILVTATNAAGFKITGTATMAINQDFVLKVPKEGITAPQIKAIVTVVGINNEIINENTVTSEACVTTITKVVADVILVVPTYGYPKIRECEVYTEDHCFNVFEDTPVFPV